jgi:hypothetical protein
VQRETIISFNTTCEKKQTTTRDKHEKTHNAKQLLLENYRAIACCTRFARLNTLIEFK